MKTFAKAQLSSVLGGIVDYIAMIFFTEVGGFFYSFSIILSGIIGAVVNFAVNRRYTFRAHSVQRRKQLPKFAIMVMCSIFLKSYGTYLLTFYGEIDYKISRLIIDAMVAIGFNFPLQKYWVFDKKEDAE